MSDAEITAISRHYAAQPLRPAGTTRDAVRFPQGEKLAREARCGTCHLPDYVGREQMPRLAGQREDYLLHSMRQFVSNQAVGRDTLMNAALHGISDAELQSIAHYLSRLAP
ncbi:MAG: c-type cytochrome [Burkholderiales bacterium]|nr:c-type cytochrome [Burkholderiales bacterium]